MEGFKSFIMKGNLVELATAFVMGTAFAAVVTATVDVIMAIIGKLGGTPNFDRWSPYGIPFGVFLTALISFIIMAAILYFFVIAPYQKARDMWFPAEPEDETPEDLVLLAEIRDLLRAQRQA